MKLKSVLIISLLSLSIGSKAQNIYDLLESRSELTVLKSLVDSTGLSKTLKTIEQATVFAPNNDAFTNLPDGVLEYLGKKPGMVKNIILFHVSPKSFTSQQLEATSSIPTAFTAPIHLANTRNGLKVITASVVEADAKATNGVVHIIDKVLLPKKLAYDYLDQSQFSEKAYLGLWYDYARTPNSFQDNTPKRDGKRLSACLDSTADYSLNQKGEVALTNTCYRKVSAGEVFMEDIDGIAKIASERRLKVAFGGPLLRGIQRIFTGGGADYWVFGVGPTNSEGLYSWALVSGIKRDNIFILTRTKRISEQVRADILAHALLEGLPVSKLIFDQDR